jgi:hypothetical protein
MRLNESIISSCRTRRHSIEHERVSWQIGNAGLQRSASINTSATEERPCLTRGHEYQGSNIHPASSGFRRRKMVASWLMRNIHNLKRPIFTGIHGACRGGATNIFILDRLRSIKHPCNTADALSDATRTMYRSFHIFIKALLVFYCSLCVTVRAADDEVLLLRTARRKGYRKGDLLPVSCLNRTM